MRATRCGGWTKNDALCSEMGVDGREVFHFEVKNGAAAGCAGLAEADGKADIAALEEGHGAGVEEEAHAQGVLVKVARAGQIGDGEGDLADFFEVDNGSGGVGLEAHDASLCSLGY